MKIFGVRIDEVRREIALALAEHFEQEPGYEHRIAVFIEHLRRDNYISLRQPEVL